MNKNYKSVVAFHPWEFLLDELRERCLSQTAFAKILWKPIKTINEIIKWKKSITAEMAILFEWVLQSSASSWLWLQKVYDLSNARIVNEAKYRTVIKNYWDYQKSWSENLQITGLSFKN